MEGEQPDFDEEDPEAESVFLGVLALEVPRRVLAEKTFVVEIARLPRLRPYITIEKALLDDESDEED